ncbi:MAG: polymer-forming cytoskeletal protein [Acidobacteriaceae bacterium]|nr:polymer-forming cytoskeletal protein [Acidobacteriaceae bacterium]
MLGTTVNRKPTESFWKSTEPPRPADPPNPISETQWPPHPRNNEADDRTLIIGPGVSVSGEITSCDRLIVQGKIEAKLTDCPNVIIREGGVFKGESSTEDAEVQGSFDGNLVVSKRLLIRATGRVSGIIAYGEIEIERGGKIAGDIKHEGGSAVSHLKPARTG